MSFNPLFRHKVPLQTPPNVADKYTCDLAAPSNAERLAADAHAPKLLDQLRARIRARHYSIRTEDAYVDWTRRLILHFDKTCLQTDATCISVSHRTGDSGSRAAKKSACFHGQRDDAPDDGLILVAVSGDDE